MTNEELRDIINWHNQQIHLILEKNGQFVLNQEVKKHKDAIMELQQLCSHKDNNGKVKEENGRCFYCKTILR